MGGEVTGRGTGAKVSAVLYFSGMAGRSLNQKDDDQTKKAETQAEQSNVWCSKTKKPPPFEKKTIRKMLREKKRRKKEHKKAMGGRTRVGVGKGRGLTTLWGLGCL